MKGIAVIITLLIAGSPVMATVTISLVDNGDLTADLVMVCDGDDADANGSLVAGLALDVSVDAGQIMEVSNYKTTGESVIGDKGYGIFPHTITFTDTMPGPLEIANTGTPVVGELPSPYITLVFGALYDQGMQEAAPPATTVLCTIRFSDACNVNLAVNATLGGVVRVGGESVVPVLIGIENPWPCDCCSGAEDCAEAVSLGCPESWCRQAQRCGDADGLKEPLGFNQFTWVGSKDVALLVSAYRVRLGDSRQNLACDFDHQKEPLGFGQYTRVGIRDVAILVKYYRTRVEAMPEECR